MIGLHKTMSNPYRELATQTPEWNDPIKVELEKIHEMFNKEDSSRVQRVLKYCLQQYKNEKEKKRWKTIDPGKWCFSQPTEIKDVDMETPFGVLLKERGEQLGFVFARLENSYSTDIYWNFKEPT